MKRCSKCGEEKELDEFRVCERWRKDYRMPACRDCENKNNRAHYAAKRESILITHRKYKASEKGKLARATWLANNKDKMKYARRKHHLRKTFGLTPHQFEQLKAKQFNRCAICKCRPTPMFIGGGVATDLHIDHCHKTSKVRGLLCSQCNTFIALAGEQIEILRNAIEYLMAGGLSVSENDQSLRKPKPPKRVQAGGKDSFPARNFWISARA